MYCYVFEYLEPYEPNRYAHMT
ncbi:hypothetical protein SBA4_320006 [Candidatus Sulfopaludibacter sp. SbA4]|nr:hypothetical protein SBA4_320006 [Candidatus Sulfopaludibacter sp. SbA4]